VSGGSPLKNQQKQLVFGVFQMKLWKKLTALALGIGLLSAPSAFAQRGPGGGGFGGGPGGGGGVGMLDNSEVQKALGLSEAQVEKIKSVDEETRTSMREAQEKITKDATSKAMAILSSEQKQRLTGILLQTQGTMAMSNPIVRETLRITDDQAKKIEEVSTSIREEMRSSFQRPEGGERPDFRTMFEEMRKKAETKLGEVLTGDQKDQIEKLKSDKFEFQNRGRGPGGQGGPGGRGPGGNGGGDAPTRPAPEL
jgi:Spy/CpxP family protein refolding chaperone